MVLSNTGGRGENSVSNYDCHLTEVERLLTFNGNRGML